MQIWNELILNVVIFYLLSYICVSVYVIWEPCIETSIIPPASSFHLFQVVVPSKPPEGGILMRSRNSSVCSIWRKRAVTLLWAPSVCPCPTFEVEPRHLEEVTNFHWLAFTVLFFKSLPGAQDHRWSYAGQLKALPSILAQKMDQCSASMLEPHEIIRPSLPLREQIFKIQSFSPTQPKVRSYSLEGEVWALSWNYKENLCAIQIPFWIFKRGMYLVIMYLSVTDSSYVKVTAEAPGYPCLGHVCTLYSDIHANKGLWLAVGLYLIMNICAICWNHSGMIWCNCKSFCSTPSPSSPLSLSIHPKWLPPSLSGHGPLILPSTSSCCRHGCCCSGCRWPSFLPLTAMMQRLGGWKDKERSIRWAKTGGGE